MTVHDGMEVHYHRFAGVYGDVVDLCSALQSVSNILKWDAVRSCCVIDGDAHIWVIHVLVVMWGVKQWIINKD